jgi:hypothetical protein
MLREWWWPVAAEGQMRGKVNMRESPKLKCSAPHHSAANGLPHLLNLQCTEMGWDAYIALCDMTVS